MLNVNYKKMIEVTVDVWYIYELIFADDFEITDLHVVCKEARLIVPH